MTTVRIHTWAAMAAVWAAEAARASRTTWAAEADRRAVTVAAAWTAQDAARAAARTDDPNSPQWR